jgi:hypothetical protein
MDFIDFRVDFTQFHLSECVGLVLGVKSLRKFIWSKIPEAQFSLQLQIFYSGVARIWTSCIDARAVAGELTLNFIRVTSSFFFACPVSSNKN